MTNIKYSKRFKLRNGERVDFCPECEYHITDTVNNSDSVYCPKCGQQIQLFKPALSRDILISKDEERFCPNILLGLLTGFYGVQKKPWQPEIGDVYFYVAVDEGRNKGVIHSQTLFNKNDIQFLLLKKAGKYYKSYVEAEKHLKEDYEYLVGE